MLTSQVRLGVTILRLAASSVFLIHGSTRLLEGTVGGFGSFLASWGIPMAVTFAWVLTIVELLGGLLLAAGYGVRPLCAWFGAELVSGIVMVHGKEGWFVVGGGRNGMEYSVLIVACLLVVALTHPAAHRLGARSEPAV
jgi:putative oxidoreductase